MNYEQLFAFAVFAEHLSFTRAAEVLHLSQPALHVQVRKLAEAVGRPLYRRKGRALALTDEGRRLAAFGREVRDRGTEVLGELRGEAPAGPVVLVSGQGAFLYLLGPAIRRFPKQRWPLRLVSMSGPEAIEALRDARGHLGVIAASSQPRDLEPLALRSVGQKVVLPSAHPLAARRSLRPADLAGEKIVVAPAGSPHRVMLEQALAAAGAALQVAVEATGWELMLQFARYGVGLAVVNDFCPEPKGMAGVPLAGVPPITYYLIGRPGAGGPGADAMRKLIVETVSRDGQRRGGAAAGDQLGGPPPPAARRRIRSSSASSKL